MKQYILNTLFLLNGGEYSKYIYNKVKSRETLNLHDLFIISILLSAVINFKNLFRINIFSVIYGFITGIISAAINFLTIFSILSMISYVLCKICQGKITYVQIINLNIALAGLGIINSIISSIPFIGPIINILCSIFIACCYIKGIIYISKCNIREFMLYVIITIIALFILFFIVFGVISLNSLFLI